MSSDIDASTLPTVLVYRRGDLEATWVRFDLEMPNGEIKDGDRGRKEVEEFLTKCATQLLPSRSVNSRFSRRFQCRRHLGPSSCAFALRRERIDSLVSPQGRRRRRRRPVKVENVASQTGGRGLSIVFQSFQLIVRSHILVLLFRSRNLACR